MKASVSKRLPEMLTNCAEERDQLQQERDRLAGELEEARELMNSVIFRHAIQDGSGLLKAVEALADWLNYDPPDNAPSR